MYVGMVYELSYYAEIIYHHCHYQFNIYWGVSALRTVVYTHMLILIIHYK